jgi:hypothetical protein
MHRSQTCQATPVCQRFASGAVSGGDRSCQRLDGGFSSAIGSSWWRIARPSRSGPSKVVVLGSVPEGARDFECEERVFDCGDVHPAVCRVREEWVARGCRCSDQLLALTRDGGAEFRWVRAEASVVAVGDGPVRGNAAESDASDVRGSSVDDAERDDRGELRVGGRVDQRGCAVHGVAPFVGADLGELEADVIAEQVAVDGDSFAMGGVDGRPGAREEFGGGCRPAR